MKGLWIEDITGQALVSYIAVFLILAVGFGSTGVIVSILNKTDGSKFGSFPYNAMIYFRLLSTPIFGLLGLGLFHLKKNYVKAFIEEFVAIYFWIKKKRKKTIFTYELRLRKRERKRKKEKRK